MLHLYIPKLQKFQCGWLIWDLYEAQSTMTVKSMQMIYCTSRQYVQMYQENSPKSVTRKPLTLFVQKIIITKCLIYCFR